MGNVRAWVLGVAALCVVGAGVWLGLSALGRGKADAVGAGQTVAVQHVKGQAQVPVRPQRVVVFDLASLDTLKAIGAEGVVGVPDYRFPAYIGDYAAANYTKVGSLFEPDYEAVNALKPDLIIIGGRSAAKYPELSKIAPTIDLTAGREDYIGDMRRNVATLGKIFGREEAAADRLARLDASIGALKAKSASAGRTLVVLTTGGRMSAHGVGSRFGVVHGAFGFTPAREGLDTGNHGQSVTAEYILETNPDWLLVVDRDAATNRDGPGAKVLDNELVRRTTAWSKGQVVYLDPPSWYLVGAGVQSVEGMVRQLTEALDKAKAAT